MDFTDLISTAGDGVFVIVAFIVALSIIVAVHEYGHYIVGRWTGIKADVFSIGFGPVLASRTDRHGTRWQIAALPFGGFVKFRGDSDAASGRDGEMIHQMSPEELRQTMHGAPLWARAATVAAGPFFNFVLAIILYTCLVFWQGLPAEPTTVGRINPTPLGEVGLEEGDVLLAVDGIALDDLAAGEATLDPKPRLDYTVLRDGQEITVEGPWWQPPLVGFVMPRSAGLAAGIEEGDYVRAIDGKEVWAFAQLSEIVRDGQGATVELDLWRDGRDFKVSLTPKVTDTPDPDGGFNTRYLIGLQSMQLFEPATRTPGVAEAISLGARQTWRVIETSVSGLYHIVARNISSCNLSGVITIAQVSGQSAAMGPSAFFALIAGLSVAIGFLNLLPIPVLDGGHLVFHTWEAITGHPPSDAALRYLMAGGLTLMLALMAFAISNDLFCP